MSRVLVIGGSGFVGRHLCTTLVQLGWEVVATWHRRPPAVAVPGVKWLALDVCDPIAVRNLLRAVRCPFLVHLAGQSSAAQSFADPESTVRINFSGSLNVFRSAAELGGCTRLVWVGSAEQYGAVSPLQIPIAEEVGFSPRNPYGHAKAAADRFAAMSFPPQTLPIVRVRLFPCTGPGQPANFVCSDFAQQVVRGERTAARICIRGGNLDVVRDFTDVRDVSAALALLLERGEGGQAYNVCSGIGRTPRQIGEQLLRLAGREGQVLSDPQKFRPADVPVLVGRNQKLSEATRWQARIPWSQTLDDLLVDWRARLSRELS